MSVSVPVTALARTLVSCTVYGGNSGTAGVITWGTGTDLCSASGTLALAAFSLTDTVQTADVTPVDGTTVTHLPVMTSPAITISEIIASDGSTALMAIANGFDFLKVIALYRPKGATSGGTYRGAMGTITNADRGWTSSTEKPVYTVSTESMGVRTFEGSSIPSTYS